MEQYLKLMDYMMGEFGGGPKVIKAAWVINFFKALTPFWVVLLMYIYQNFTTGAYVYLALHGSYGIVWLVKDLSFPDRGWQRYITFGSVFVYAFPLSLYWGIGFVQISNHIDPTIARACTAIILNILGVTLMTVSDAQKYYTLKYKKGLITEGMFKYNRNPNYTGEMMLYASFAILNGSMYSYGVLALVWICVFYPTMYQKDVSFSKKEGWALYKKQSQLIGWRVSQNDLINYSLYGALAYGLWIYFEIENINIMNYIIDLVCGSFAGVCYVTMSQPFDTIKVRMQMIAHNRSMIITAIQMFQREGFFSFYKGIVPPLLFGFPCSAIQFAAYEHYLQGTSSQRWNWFIAGAYAGLMQCAFASPPELFKNVFQMQIHDQKFTSLLGCARQLIKREGFLSIFRGLGATIIRDVPQYAFYFMIYEDTKRCINLNPLCSQLIAGALAGLVCITVSYPQDVIKTKMQCQAALPSNQWTSWSATVASTWRTQQIRGFWQGYNSSVVYYMVACATQLAGYEFAKSYLWQFRQ